MASTSAMSNYVNPIPTQPVSRYTYTSAHSPPLVVHDRRRVFQNNASSDPLSVMMIGKVPVPARRCSALTSTL